MKSPEQPMEPSPEPGTALFAEEKLLHLAMVFCNCLDVSANVGEVATLQVMIASFLRHVCSIFDVEAHT